LDCPFEGLLSPGSFNENAPHGFGRGSEEMAAAVPLLASGTDQAEPGFMHKSGGLQCVAGGFPGHFLGRELSEFLIHQRKQLVSGLGVALLNGFEYESRLAYELDTIT
jgi:hypothetical protein